MAELPGVLRNRGSEVRKLGLVQSLWRGGPAVLSGRIANHLVGHLFTEYQPAGGEMPFWAMARLGGDDSELADQQPLRGGHRPFRGRQSFGREFRSTHPGLRREPVWHSRHARIAPFAEAGRVARSMSYDPVAWSALHPVGGVGFRGIAEPFVVGYVDVGWGGEGAAVFSGINYPF